jgi:hypothetical protein
VLRGKQYSASLDRFGVFDDENCVWIVDHFNADSAGFYEGKADRNQGSPQCQHIEGSHILAWVKPCLLQLNASRSATGRTSAVPFDTFVSILH